jgi:hypothetical protein
MAISRVSVVNVSEISTVSIIRVDMVSGSMSLTKQNSETSVFTSTLTRLLSRENINTFIRRESFKLYFGMLTFSYRIIKRKLIFWIRNALSSTIRGS